MYDKEKAQSADWYNFVAKQYSGYSDWTFMNYGYADLAEGPGSEINHCLELYRQVISDIPLHQKQILEVGCGRGGGSSFILKEYSPKSMIAVDLSMEGVRFCTKQHAVSSLHFLNGDAECLPFVSNTFDAVVNVESSHCYPNAAGFLRSVHRVLKPGGYFLFTDFRMNHAVPILKKTITDAGLEILEDRDITENVVRSLTLDGDVKITEISKHVPISIQAGFRQFAAVPGTNSYNALAFGWQKYLKFICKKT